MKIYIAGKITGNPQYKTQFAGTAAMLRAVGYTVLNPAELPEGMTMAEYLDKEAFKKSVEERYCKPCKAEGKDHNGCWCRACWVDDMLDDVDCFQPADVAPVVHGVWVRVHKIDPISGYRGSKCRRMVGYALTPYCPNCGAKMDGKDGDNAEG